MKKIFKITLYIALFVLYPAIIVIKYILHFLARSWCLFIHGFLLNKHKTYIAYGDEQCIICGRVWYSDI